MMEVGFIMRFIFVVVLLVKFDFKNFFLEIIIMIYIYLKIREKFMSFIYIVCVFRKLRLF